MMLAAKTCPNCSAALARRSRWFGLVKHYGNRCPRCDAQLAYDTAGGVWLIVGRHSTQDAAEARRLARRNGIPWPSPRGEET